VWNVQFQNSHNALLTIEGIGRNIRVCDQHQSSEYSCKAPQILASRWSSFRTCRPSKVTRLSSFIKKIRDLLPTFMKVASQQTIIWVLFDWDRIRHYSRCLSFRCCQCSTCTCPVRTSMKYLNIVPELKRMDSNSYGWIFSSGQ
jgi:hypothetical protein